MDSGTGSTPPLPPDPLQLQRRLLRQGGGFALLILLSFSAALYGGIARQREEDQRQELRQRAAGAAAELPLILHEAREAEGPLKFRGQPRLEAIAGLERQRVQWFDPAGRLLKQQGSLPLPPSLAEAGPSGAAAERWQQWPGGLSLRIPVHSASGGATIRLGSVRVALSDQAARRDLRRLQRGLLLGAIVAVLAALLVGRRMLQAAFAPLRQQVEALQRFSADASHELRHPLTAMRAVLAAVPESLRRSPEFAWHELDALARRQAELLDDLLLLARLEQGGVTAVAPSEQPQHFDLLELLEDLIHRTAPLAARRHVRLDLSPDPATSVLPVRGQSEQLERLFTNLLLNAIRHSPEGGSVAVAASPGAQRLQIAVIDAGPGIDPQQRERVFERFWRGDDQAGRSGLGLAIARSLARRHGGDLRVAESRPGRCVLLVELPRAEPLS